MVRILGLVLACTVLDVQSAQSDQENNDVLSKLDQMQQAMRIMATSIDQLQSDLRRLREQVIPRTIHFIWMQRDLLKELPMTAEERENAQNIAFTARLNPGYDVNVHTDDACSRECNATGIEGVAALYQQLRGTKVRCWPSNYACMADVCRLAVLYNKGGIYMDANMEPRMPIDEWLDGNAKFMAAQY